MARLTRDEAESFLFHEAELLDQRRLDEWLALFTEDGVYLVPMDAAEDDRKDRLALMRDDALRRKERVYRILHTRPPSQDPPSRTQHFVSNVRVEATADDRAVVRSAQLVCEIRRGSGDDRQLGLGEQQIFAATCEHRLERHGDAWRIALKKVVLLNRDLPIPNLGFLL